MLCCGNEQDSDHGAMQLVARERLEILVSPSMRCARHFFVDVCILEKHLDTISSLCAVAVALCCVTVVWLCD